MPLNPPAIHHYRIFLASPGDVAKEREVVRRFFEQYNRHTAHIWGVHFDVIDWENYSTIGVGRPQELINQQTLERFRDSLVLVIGIMSQRFGTYSGKAESGTREEFDVAMASWKATGFPEIKWFFRKVDRLDGVPIDRKEAEQVLEQWQKVSDFRNEMKNLDNPIFFTEYPGADTFLEVFERDLQLWLADSTRPWAGNRNRNITDANAADLESLPLAFEAERYQAAILKRYDKLNFEMLDTTGASYNGVRLWSIFIPQSARECHQYNPRLLEIPKEHRDRLLKAGHIVAEELADAEREANRLRQEYFNQPLNPVLDVVDLAIGTRTSGFRQNLVILGDPGSGKSSLIRYLALRWARTSEPIVRDELPIPLVIDLGSYSRWQCDGQKGFVRFLEESAMWHDWPGGLLERLLGEPGRIVVLMDGLDEVFDVTEREAVVSDIARLSNQFSDAPIVVTSRVVGYQPQRLRGAEFRHFMLQDLDAEQIVAFVDRWHDETFETPEQANPKRDRLKKAIRDSKSIAMLAGNPLLLTMMAILNRNQELPRDRADLYAQATRVLLHQWDTERALEGFPGMSTEIGLRERTDILRRVAAHMQSCPSGLKGNMIDGSTLACLIESYLQGELHFTQARAAARAVVEQLRQRNFILCFVGADSYSFVHRTFLEYFCASEIVHRFNVVKSLDFDGLLSLFDQHCRQDEWHEVLRLVCGQIDESFVGRIVEHLASKTDLRSWDCETALPEIPLAIGCLNEVRTPAKIVRAGDALMSRVIQCFSAHGDAGLREFLERIIAAGREIGARWPLSIPLGDRALELSKLIGGWGDLVWPEFVAQIDPNRSIIERFASSTKWEERVSALRALIEKWPDENTHQFLTQRAGQEVDDTVQCRVLRVLANNWPDDDTRQLLIQHSGQNYASGVRSTALRALADKWPDVDTRQLLTQRGGQDDDSDVRSKSLRALADNWPDDDTRQLLTRRASQDDGGDVRSTALRALADNWPDADTRQLLTQRVSQDDGGDVRSAALRALADKWPDADTRQVLTQRADQDGGGDVRSTALRALADKWPDADTRQLLTQRGGQDDDSDVRSKSLRALADNWPDDDTRQLLTQRACQDDDGDVRSTAASCLAAMHSRFACLLVSRDVDGLAPFLDPLKPIPRDHIERAAKRGGIKSDEVDAQVASLSAHLGWDVTRGIGLDGRSPNGKTKRRRR